MVKDRKYKNVYLYVSFIKQENDKEFKPYETRYFTNLNKAINKRIQYEKDVREVHRYDVEHNIERRKIEIKHEIYEYVFKRKILRINKMA